MSRPGSVSQAMKAPLKMAGFAACLFALGVMNGGHWLALQSLAWGRMIVVFSQQDSLGTALAKTFSGRHPCALCLKVRAGWQQEQGQTAPCPKMEKDPEVLWKLCLVTAPPGPAAARDCPIFSPVCCSDFIDSPPKPPPRGQAAAV